MRTAVACACGAIALGGCASPSPTTSLRPLPSGAEALSLTGDTLRALTLSPRTRAEYEARLREAEADLAARPNDPDALIWVGRRTAYLGRYRDAIAVFTRGIARFPADARFPRHRGHRYITVREMDRAIADLERAARLVRGKPDEVEPDGLPNARNIPTSTLQSNIWYHLGLAHYLTGDFESALRAYREAMKVSRNPDMLVATSHWLYMTLRRLGRTAEAATVLAPISRGLDVIENDSYHRLLLMYKGELPVDSLLGSGADDGARALNDATVGYGIGNWHLYSGRRDDAQRVFRRIIAGGNWPAFGYIAAEAELARGVVARNP